MKTQEELDKIVNFVRDAWTPEPVDEKRNDMTRTHVMQLEEENMCLRGKLKLNSAMLARQTDLAREAESERDDFRNALAILQKRYDVLYAVYEGLENTVRVNNEERRNLKEELEGFQNGQDQLQYINFSLLDTIKKYADERLILKYEVTRLREKSLSLEALMIEIDKLCNYSSSHKFAHLEIAELIAPHLQNIESKP